LRGDLNFSKNLIEFNLQASFSFVFLVVLFIVVGWLAGGLHS